MAGEVTSRRERMLRELLRAQQGTSFDDLAEAVEGCAGLGGMAAEIYLVDIQQRWLVRLRDAGVTGGEHHALRVDGTLAGRAFREAGTIEVVGEDRRQVWLPLRNGAERLGVLRLDTDRDESDVESEVQLASMVALLIVSKRPQSDTYASLTRTRDMALSAEVQWALLPPLTFATGSLTISGALEPAYEVGGDIFDYAVTDHVAYVAVLDAMGHDLSAGLAASMTVGSWRNGRRRPGGVDLADIADRADRALVAQFDCERYVTGVLASLDTVTGWFSWVSRGHPAPLLIRHGRLVKTLECPPGAPMGLGLTKPVTACHEQLEPGDRLLLFTDGVTDARNPAGEFFGTERFVDFINRRHMDGLSAPETLRQLVHTLLDYQQAQLVDDATIVLVEWRGRSSS